MKKFLTPTFRGFVESSNIRRFMDPVNKSQEVEIIDPFNVIKFYFNFHA